VNLGHSGLFVHDKVERKKYSLGKNMVMQSCALLSVPESSYNFA
jgi:hypothetical protein